MTTEPPTTLAAGLERMVTRLRATPHFDACSLCRDFRWVFVDETGRGTVRRCSRCWPR
jgi:hypothetical protein